MPNRPVSGIIQKPAPRPRAIFTENTMAPPQTSTKATNQKVQLRSERARQILLFLEEEERQAQAQAKGKGKGEDKEDKTAGNSKTSKKTVPNTHLQPQPAREHILGIDPGLQWTKRAAGAEDGASMASQKLHQQEGEVKPMTWPDSWRLQDLGAFRSWSSRYLKAWVKEGWPLAGAVVNPPVDDKTTRDEDNDIRPQSPVRPKEVRLPVDEDENKPQKEPLEEPQKKSHEIPQKGDNNGDDSHPHHRGLPSDQAQGQAPFELPKGVPVSSLSLVAGGGGGGTGAEQVPSSNNIRPGDPDSQPISKPVPFHDLQEAPLVKLDEPSPPPRPVQQGSGHSLGVAPLLTGHDSQHHVTDSVADRFPLPFSTDLLSLAAVPKHQRKRYDKGQGGGSPANRGKPFGVDRDEDEGWYKWWAARHNKSRQDKKE